MKFDSKYGEVKVYAKTVEDEAIKQIIEISNSILGKDSHLRIMPDCHAGKGCVIGTTMKITDKICPNIVGVDIGCGVTLIKTNVNFKPILKDLDEHIRQHVPHGKSIHSKEIPYDFTELICYNELDKKTKVSSQHSLGTLGGGNHFIEAYDDGYLAVHSGSRNIGVKVAKHYQKLAEMQSYKPDLKNIPPKEREKYLKNIFKTPKHLKYLKGDLFFKYLHDINIIQNFADSNRHNILKNILSFCNGKIIEEINSIHNYIDVKNMTLRKGAISAKQGELLVIPLNMRDGILLCEGKGNADWNFSAPHGAGRLYSRSKAKEKINIEDFQKSMEGIYTTSVNENTIDESPFAYKDYKEIINCIQPTVNIIKRIKPIYNFKAN